MPLFNHLPGFQRSPAGLEWRLLKRLPAIWGWGTLAAAAPAALLWLATPALAATAADRQAYTTIYLLLGCIGVHWSLVLAVAIGCAIVWVMKGPAYVADAYPMPERDGAG